MRKSVLAFTTMLSLAMAGSALAGPDPWGSRAANGGKFMGGPGHRINQVNEPGYKHQKFQAVQNLPAGKRFENTESRRNGFGFNNASHFDQTNRSPGYNFNNKLHFFDETECDGMPWLGW